MTPDLISILARYAGTAIRAFLSRVAAVAELVAPRDRT